MFIAFKIRLNLFRFKLNKNETCMEIFSKKKSLSIKINTKIEKKKLTFYLKNYKKKVYKEN